jgi:predicted permease
MSPSALATTVLTFVGIVGVGWLLRATGRLKASDVKPINAIIIYVGLPAFIIRTVHSARLDRDLAVVVAIAWAVFAVTLLLAWLVARMLRLPRVVTGGFLLTAALGNTGYIGYSIVSALLGKQALPHAIFYDVFGTVGALLIVGLAVAEHYAGSAERRKHPLREVLGFPAVIALVIGLASRGIAIPNVVSGGLDLLANLTVPLIMISVGLSLRMGALRRWALPLAAVVALRLAVAPLLAYALGSVALAGDTRVLALVTLQAGMPAMMLSLVVGARFELDTDFIASAIFVTTAASALSIPLLQLLVA